MRRWGTSLNDVLNRFEKAAMQRGGGDELFAKVLAKYIVASEAKETDLGNDA